jgi:hypothetical protein
MELKIATYNVHGWVDSNHQSNLDRVRTEYREDMDKAETIGRENRTIFQEYDKFSDPSV